MAQKRAAALTYRDGKTLKMEGRMEPCTGIDCIAWIYKPAEERVCFVCHKDDAHHFCYGRNAYIHAQCAIKFLQTEEAKPIIEHGHMVRLDFRLD